MITIVDFEDLGQHFLQWKINEAGVIIECTPAQSAFWVGRIVANAFELLEGKRVHILRQVGNPIIVKYLITKVKYE